MQGLLGMKANLKVDPRRLKMLRETLCLVQVQYYDYINDIQLLINEIDKHRPLGSDGKHGNLHTETCGCEKEEVNGS